MPWDAILYGGPLIIGDNGRETVGEGLGTFTLVSADGAHELSLRLTGTLSAEFREHLAAQGFHVPEGDARSVVTEIVVATASNPAAWTAVGGTVVAFLTRHRGKVHRFDVEGESVTIEGYSARDARKLAEEVVARSRERGSRRTSRPADRQIDLGDRH